MTRRLFAVGAGSLSPTLRVGLKDVQLSRIASLNDFEVFAKVRLPATAYNYIAGGVGDEVTLRANLQAWNLIRVRPAALVDVSQINIGVTLLGKAMKHPVLLAPTAYHRLCHPDGELATVKDAAQTGTTMIVSSFANNRVEDINAAAPATTWYQLYVPRDRGFARAMIQTAEAAGCKALCLTVDSPARGYRDRDIRNGFALPPGLDRPNYRGLGTTKNIPLDDVYHPVQDPSFVWRDLEWLRATAKIRWSQRA